MALLRGFATFSQASGLYMNKRKSEVYFNGVEDALMQEILQVSGFQRGQLPFRYLGVTISSKRLNAADCHMLTEKIVARIRSLGARKLSYRGRLVLINSVLITLHSYWATIFIIPSTIMNKIEAICRNFLWSGMEHYEKTPQVSWEKVCTPQTSGGLGILHGKLWNQACIGKLVWWITSKADHLWVKWINHIYLKGHNWLTYTPTQDSSWAWRKICQVRNKLLAGYAGTLWSPRQEGYSVSSGYSWLCGPSNSVTWAKVVWNKWNVPKHSFILWLVMHKRLLTLQRLKAFGIDTSTTCYLCQQEDETIDHLLFSCSYSKRCLTVLFHRMQFPVIPVNVWQWCIRHAMNSKLQRRVTWATCAALTYMIWQVRNECRLHHKIPRPEYLIEIIFKNLKPRILYGAKFPLLKKDEQWLRSRSLL